MLTDTLPYSEIAGPLSAEIDQATDQQWSDLLSGFDDASVYQSWAYGSVHWGERQLSHLVVKRGSRVVGIAQVRLVQLPLIKKGVAYVRWGPLCRLRGESFNADALRQVTEAMRQEYGERRGLLLRMIPPVFTNDPFANRLSETWSELGLSRNPEARVDRTMRVDLSVSLQDLRAGLHQRWRNYLKGAEKLGFTVTQGTGMEFYDKFLLAYREMMARKRFDTTVDVDEFRRIQEELPEPLRMQIFLCEKEGKLFNALVVAAAGDTGIYLLAGTSNEGLNAKGAYLLQWRAIEWLKGRGFHWYDLGGINPDGNPGVFQFKNGMGGQDVHQAGVYELSGGWLSSACVRSGEQLQSAVRSIRSRIGKRS
jgi:hypothetical protein